MLTELERDEIVAAVARDLGVAISPNDPVFVAVAANQLVLARATSVVARQVERDLAGALRARDSELTHRVAEAVNAEIHRLTKGAARARGSVERVAKGWAVALTALGLLEAVVIWLAQGGR